MRLFKAATTSRRKSAVSTPIIEPSFLKSPVAVSIRSEMSESRGSVTSFSAISSGPHSTFSDKQHRFVRRPNLSQILADQAPSPWTLEAFTAYAERNMCLENIEFIQDAEHYREAYRAAVDVEEKYRISPSTDDRETSPLRRMDSAQTETLKELWMRIMLLYVAPSSPKELNLPSDIRAALIPHNQSAVPAPPHLLDPAIHIIYELIEDSILFSFLGELNASYQPSMSSQDDLALEGERLHNNQPTSDAHKGTLALPPAARSPKLGAFGFSKTRLKASSASRSPSNGRAANVASLAEEDGDTNGAGATRDTRSPPPKTPPPTSSLDSKKLSPIYRKDPSWKRMSARFGFSRKAGTHLREVMEDQQPTSIDERQ